MTRGLRPLGLLLLVLGSSAHVGSRDILYAGPAGPYLVRVLIQPPGVIPGAALVSVRVESGGAERVTLQPVRWDLGPANAPDPEAARPDGDGFSGTVWLMSPGSYGLHLVVTGVRGEGRLVIPVSALALERKPLAGAGWILLLAGLGILAFGAVGIIRGMARVSTLPAGASIGPLEAERGRRGLTIGLLTVGGLLGLWSAWWWRVDAAYVERLYRTPRLDVTAVSPSVDGELRLAIIPDSTRGWRPLLADHGRPMHLFLLREPALDALAHLHPRMIDSTHLAAALPPLPSGRYRVYADVVHDDGLAETLTAAVSLVGRDSATSPADSEDAWWTAGGDDELRWSLADSAPVAGVPTNLRVAVTRATGEPALLEPYLGMPGHAVVSRADGAVFVHLHPEGTASRAAQQRLGDAGMPAHDHGLGAGEVTFPFLFPLPGRYRLWVQVRSAGVIHTGALDLEVRPASTTRLTAPG